MSQISLDNSAAALLLVHDFRGLLKKWMMFKRRFEGVFTSASYYSNYKCSLTLKALQLENGNAN